MSKQWMLMLLRSFEEGGLVPVAQRREAGPAPASDWIEHIPSMPALPRCTCIKGHRALVDVIGGAVWRC